MAVKRALAWKKTYIKDKDGVFWKSFQIRLILSEVDKVSVNDLRKEAFKQALNI